MQSDWIIQRSKCRDGADIPISLNKSNNSELMNADDISLLRQTALRVLLYTIILSKYVKYTATVILGKL